MKAGNQLSIIRKLIIFCRSKSFSLMDHLQIYIHAQKLLTLQLPSHFSHSLVINKRYGFSKHDDILHGSILLNGGYGRSGSKCFGTLADRSCYLLWWPRCSRHHGYLPFLTFLTILFRYSFF